MAESFTTISRRDGEPDVERALMVMEPLGGSELDAGCYEGLLGWQGRGQTVKPVRPRIAGGPTEREVEVLRLACAGHTDREIAKTLVLSEKTVEHHFEHLCNELGVTSRTAASVFAVQQGLAS